MTDTTDIVVLTGAGIAKATWAALGITLPDAKPARRVL